MKSISEAHLEEIKQCLRVGQKIEAISIYRTATDSGIAEAKKAVEELEVELQKSASPVPATSAPASSAGTETKLKAAPGGKGCLSVIAAMTVVLSAVGYWLWSVLS